MMGSIFCNRKNEKTNPMCVLGDFCRKWRAQLSQSSSDVSKVRYCSTSSVWANVEGNTQDHQADGSRKAALISDILSGLCSLATSGTCYVGFRQKDPGNSSVDPTPLLPTELCHCKVWGNEFWSWKFMSCLLSKLLRNEKPANHSRSNVKGNSHV